MSKRCNKCSVEITSDNAYRNKTAKNGISSLCKACDIKASKEWAQNNRAKYRAHVLKSNRKRNYARMGVTIEFVEDYGDSIEWYCEICGADIIDNMHTDHDHSTGKFRGLLCPTCNQGLGLFKDSPELMLNAVEYLKKFLED